VIVIDVETRRRARLRGDSATYCLVSPALPGLYALLVEHYADDPHIEVLIERRHQERRRGPDRRRVADDPPPGRDRRLAESLEGRRFAERRAPIVSLEKWPALPRAARPYADRLSFVRSVRPSKLELHLSNLGATAAGWRDRSEELADEARANRLLGRTQGADALLAALAARDSYTWEHSVAVVWLATGCAREMELGEEEAAEVYDVALLHDVGKLGVPDAILGKEGPLSDLELEIVRRHPVIGAEIVQSIDTLRHLAPAIRAEHERWDGRGYPDGLAGRQIPLASRITFVCDSYHAMISDRPYRTAFTREAARRELVENRGTQFCPDSVEALLLVLDEAP
jgi:HD-GYP domain-containing protein (c-di-GMP phosphodiesterase class II)